MKEINETNLFFHNAQIGIGKEYTIEHTEYILAQYKKIMRIDTAEFVYGSGKRKTCEQNIMKN